MLKNITKTVLLFVLLPLWACNGAAQSGQDIEKKDIAIQLYSVRSLINAELKNPEDDGLGYVKILEDLANMGYTAVEAAGYSNGKFYNRTPEEFKQDVESVGMRVLSSHCNKALSKEEVASGDFSESLKWWDGAIEAHKAAGMEYIVVPWMDVPESVKELQLYCDYFNEIGKKCNENGMKFGYHNHAHEFQKVEGDVVMMDYLIENTNPELVFIQLDVYWSVIGRNSPVDYFKKYPGRFKVLHIKDLRELGQSGMVGFDAIFANTDVAGVENIVVEVEQYSYEVDESVKQSIDYLLTSPFVKASYAGNN